MSEQEIKIVQGPTREELQASLFEKKYVGFIAEDGRELNGVVEGIEVGEFERGIWIITSFLNCLDEQNYNGVYETPGNFGEFSLATQE